MRIAIDLDNTIDAYPTEFQSIMSALMAAGQVVTVVTGSGSSPVTQSDWQRKCDYLTQLGCGECWNDLVVLAHPDGPVADIKAQWCKDNSVDALIDNDKGNAKAAMAAGIPLVLVPWATRK